MKGEEDCRTISFFLAKIVGSKKKPFICEDVDFGNFAFAYFEIEESFGLIWLKLQNGQFHLQISILGT